MVEELSEEKQEMYDQKYRVEKLSKEEIDIVNIESLKKERNHPKFPQLGNLGWFKLTFYKNYLNQCWKLGFKLSGRESYFPLSLLV